MRRRSVPFVLPALLVVGLLGTWAGTALGELPPPPPVTLPTVTVPSITVPIPPSPPPAPPPVPPVPPTTVPTVEPPKPPVDPPAPPAPVPSPAPEPSSPQPEQSSPPPAGQAGGPGASPGRPARPRPARRGGETTRTRRGTSLTRVRVSRSWLAERGPRSARGVTIAFWLSRPGTVLLDVDELAPECRYVGHLLVRAHAGRNVFRFRGHVRGRMLAAGTYRLTARPRGRQGKQLAGVTVTILDRPAGRTGIDAARARNTCPGGTAPSADRQTGGVPGAKSPTVSRRPHRDDPLDRALDASLGTLAAATDAVPPALFALAGLAILLLTAAAMPQPLSNSRAGATLVHHRGTIALAGVAVLVAAVVNFALL